MQILIINSGSSSIKFQVIKMPSEDVIAKGSIERIGFEDAKLHFKSKTNSESKVESIPSHEEGLSAITKLLMDENTGILKTTDDIHVVAHRVVHGGNQFDRPTIIDEKVVSEIERLASLAPLHNPANAEGIKISQSIFSNAKQVAVFDTAFHQTIPEKAHLYAIPKSVSSEHNIRMYGFHGTSHKYVANIVADYLGKKQSKIICIHLGNGCSMTAVKDGISVDHSLGFGPSNGLIMGTRSGDIDQSVLFYLMDSLGMTSEQVNGLVQKQSGLLGLTGHSDLRDVQEGAINGNKDCKLALAMTAYRIKKYIGSYVAVLNGADAIVFTAGIGENSSLLREMVCDNMDAFGILMDKDKNLEKPNGTTEIHSANSMVKLLIVPTNEELEIAKQAYSLLNPH
ncbi:MAG: acetate kinase [Bacteroidota bacterium]